MTTAYDLTVAPGTPHKHACKAPEECEGPCVCSCGAVLAMGPTFHMDGRWAWKMPDGSFEEWK